MRAHGNSDIRLCVDNLLRTFRGEIPYERVKGINPRFIDRPIAEVKTDIVEDAEWLIETYEPRAVLRGITLEQTDGLRGGFVIKADIDIKEEG